MLELFVIGVVGLFVAATLGFLGVLFSLLFGLLVLPFKLLGAVFRGVGFLVALPFLLLGGVLGLCIFGPLVLLFAVPLLPLLLLAGLIWLLRRPGARTA